MVPASRTPRITSANRKYVFTGCEQLLGLVLTRLSGGTPLVPASDPPAASLRIRANNSIRRGKGDRPIRWELQSLASAAQSTATLTIHRRRPRLRPLLWPVPSVAATKSIRRDRHRDRHRNRKSNSRGMRQSRMTGPVVPVCKSDGDSDCDPDSDPDLTSQPYGLATRRRGGSCKAGTA